jgi:regulator of sigma E protease
MAAVIHFITYTLLPFVFVLGLLIFVHELGHFLAAKLAGIRVERFSLGFPPRLIGKKWGDTDYCISALPFGGYVKMAGMIDESLDKDGIKGEPDEFMSKPILTRLGVMAAGPGMNFVLAIVIFAGATFFTGIPEPIGPVIGSVLPGEPAEQIGMQAGDRIVSLNSEVVESWDDVVRIIHASPEKEVSLTYERMGEIISATVVPKLDEINGVGLIGIAPETKVRPAGFFEAIGNGFATTWYLTKLVVRSLGMIITGKVDIRKGLAGPIGIAKMTSESAKSGFGALLMFAAFLSLNLGFLNILPIPVLDGGHIVFLAIEAVKRKPLTIKTRLIVQQIGMALLLALMVFFIFNDIARFF